MSSPTIAYDVVRLLLAARLRTPRGIDRIDYGIASRRMADWPGDCVAVMPTPWGIRTFDRERVLKARAFYEDRWPGESSPLADEEDPGISNGRRGVRTPSRLGPQTWAAALGILRRTGLSLGRPVRSLPPGTVVVNAGHDSLSQAWLLAWLRRKRDVRLLAMVHDLVPVRHPHLVTPGAVIAHDRLLDHVAGYASAVLTPSQAVAADVTDALRGRGRSAIPVYPLRLPVQDVFLGGSRGVAHHAAFVVCGTVEARKNHALLLDIWDQLLTRHGAACPRLVIAGALGPRADRLASRIEAAVAGGAVSWRPNLPTPSIRTMLAGARAVLMPSLAEGFGLPIAEGLALGVPVIASDIPAHREAGGPAALYLSPEKGAAWLSAIESLAFDPGTYATAQAKAKSFQPTTWSQYMTALAPILQRVSAEPGVP